MFKRLKRLRSKEKTEAETTTVIRAEQLLLLGLGDGSISSISIESLIKYSKSKNPAILNQAVIELGKRKIQDEKLNNKVWKALWKAHGVVFGSGYYHNVNASYGVLRRKIERECSNEEILRYFDRDIYSNVFFSKIGEYSVEELLKRSPQDHTIEGEMAKRIPIMIPKELVMTKKVMGDNYMADGAIPRMLELLEENNLNKTDRDILVSALTEIALETGDNRITWALSQRSS